MDENWDFLHVQWVNRLSKKKGVGCNLWVWIINILKMKESLKIGEGGVWKKMWFLKLQSH